MNKNINISYNIGQIEEKENHENWLSNHEGNNIDNWFQTYIAALYFSISTITTGIYGEIYPITMSEKVWTKFIIIIHILLKI